MDNIYYLSARAGRLLLVFVGLSMIIFSIARLVPGDPARIALGPMATPEQVAELRESMGLNEPLVSQYIQYVGNLLEGDMGESTMTGRAVFTDIQQALPATLELVVVAVFFTACLGIPLGLFAAYKPNGVFDQFSRIISLVGVVTPSFLLAIMLQLMASVGWFDLPVTERMSSMMTFDESYTGLLLIDSLLAGRFDVFADSLQHILLPAIALSAAGISQVMRITRSSMIEFSHRDHVETLRACGVSRPLVNFKYLLRLSASAPLTILGLEFASLIGNAFVVEMVFSWPGVASYGVRSILHKDFNAVVGVVLVSGVFFIVANLLIDFVIGLVDPRVKLKGKS
ncbi:ABC transporter permease [Vibrio gazogenes]|uniref:Peptide/nickel transport system permease protein n=1 Tax=Vibrio gazogenes DSM 21264 = NBRC 103151 TaxID=1123492 RepID=A0A1M5DU99_VIBGA|nr:ABC transporter permease [Vibrio gazogenes]USP14870.1 ABC transporter permease [Vibrio gazogenes]SHF70382.1 peptide/nickel transport system permease protein [Vibrio gazogenes DSM 21264] [Vibrio gazogenes DSM 21264 = NBRC 103151]